MCVEFFTTCAIGLRRYCYRSDERKTTKQEKDNFNTVQLENYWLDLTSVKCSLMSRGGGHFHVNLVHVQNFGGWQAVSLGGGVTVMEKRKILVGWVTKVCLKCTKKLG